MHLFLGVIHLQVWKQAYYITYWNIDSQGMTKMLHYSLRINMKFYIVSSEVVRGCEVSRYIWASPTSLIMIDINTELLEPVSIPIHSYSYLLRICMFRKMLRKVNLRSDLHCCMILSKFKPQFPQFPHLQEFLTALWQYTELETWKANKFIIIIYSYILKLYLCKYKYFIFIFTFY